MLFTGLPFFFIFLPVALAGFFLLARSSPRLGLAFLALMSFVFYAVESPKHLPLLALSIWANFAVASRLSDQGLSDHARKRWLTVGVVGNLLVLAVFKYTGFLVANVAAITGTAIPRPDIALPVGISFFTFTQIAYLVDHYKYRNAEYDFTRYCLFVTYFPHLVAGPIIHHAQVMPQFNDPAMAKPRGTLIALGFAIFAIGLVKKVIFADGAGAYAEAAFNAADKGAAISQGEAWIGALCYTFQLYFDFSGYSDMAIGLSWMLGVQLPFNFNSPYQARSITEFWRRWHISLSSFLRDYLYIALGGNRKGSVRRFANLFTTMILGGLWHGASWNFVLWGGLHGAFLIVNHGWRVLLGTRHAEWSRSAVYRTIAWAITLLCVVHAWVYFRATTLSGAHAVFASMWGVPAVGPLDAFSQHGLTMERGVFWVTALGAIALWLPNSNVIGEKIRSGLKAGTNRWPFALGFALTWCIALLIVNFLRGDVSPFIYFNF